MPNNFDEYGNFHGTISQEAVGDCCVIGTDAHEIVEYWVEKLNFTVPRQQAINYLAEFGAWPRKSDEYDVGLDDMTNKVLADKVFWIACGEIQENGAWFGLIH